MSRFAGLCVALALATVTWSAPAPMHAPADVRLQITAWTPSPREDVDDDLAFEVTVSNRSGRPATLPLYSHSGEIKDCRGVEFVARFADGTVLSFVNRMPPPPGFSNDDFSRRHPKPSAYTLAARGKASFTCEEMSQGRNSTFERAYRKNKGVFTLTATIPKLGLRSNTIRYHGCPLPPDDFDPLTVEDDY